MKHTGNLIITKENQGKYKKLKEVTGDLYINSNVTLPVLASVGGDLSINSNVTFEAPVLASVGGDLSINSNVTLPVLASVGGYFSIYSNVTFEAKFLKGLNWKALDRTTCSLKSFLKS